MTTTPAPLPPIAVTPTHLTAAAKACAAQKRITPAMLAFYEAYSNRAATAVRGT